MAERHRINKEYRPELTLNLETTEPLVLDAYGTATLAELAPMLDGKPHERERAEITLRELGEKFRMQKIVFEVSSEIFDQMKPTWKGSREYLLARLIRLVETFIASGKVQVHPPVFDRDDFRRRIVMAMNMSKVVQHIWQKIRFENSLVLEPVFDSDRPIRATGDMLPWYTGKACEHTKHSHINMCVFDSRIRA
jgi:type III restriction enzyme